MKDAWWTPNDAGAYIGRQFGEADDVARSNGKVRLREWVFSGEVTEKPGQDWPDNPSGNEGPEARVNAAEVREAVRVRLELMKRKRGPKGPRCFGELQAMRALIQNQHAKDHNEAAEMITPPANNDSKVEDAVGKRQERVKYLARQYREAYGEGKN
jgi:hypothetical protein